MVEYGFQPIPLGIDLAGIRRQELTIPALIVLRQQNF